MNERHVKKTTRYTKIVTTAEKKLTQERTTAVLGRHLSHSVEILRKQKQAFESVQAAPELQKDSNRTSVNTISKLLLYNKCGTAKWKLLQVQNFCY